MWKVKRMNTARIVVLTIAVGAGGVAAGLASGSDSKPPPAKPVAQLRTVDVLVAQSDFGPGQTLTQNDMQWQTWPASTWPISGPTIRAPGAAASMRLADGVTHPTTIQK